MDTPTNQKTTKYRQLTRLFQNLKKDQMLLLILCMLSITADLYFAYQIQGLVDLIVSGAEFRLVGQFFLQMLALGCVNFALGIAQTRYWHLFRYKTMNQMRVMMHGKLLRKEAVFFDGKTTGDTVSAIMSDGSLIAETAGISFMMLFLNVWRIFLILFVLLRANPVLGLVECAAGGLYFLAVNQINKRMRNSYTVFSAETAKLNQRIVENFKAIFEIKTLNEKEYFDGQFQEQIKDRYFPAAKSVVHLNVLSYSVNEFINILFPMFILVAGCAFTYNGLLTIGTVILFYTYTQKLVEPLNNLSDFYRGTQVAVGAADRVYDYLFGEEKMSVPVEYKETDGVSLEIDIDSFGWEGKEAIIRNVHEKYISGDKVFIQGESGTGKSTLLKLICGFYDIPDGEIKVNHHDVSKMGEEQLFQYIKIQFQEPIMLEGTLRENLELGKRFSEEELWNSLKIVNMDGFAMENGMDYAIAENGKNLSGGQKQRLALARVILRRPSILILDEATSALDAKNEEEIVKNLNEYVDKNGGILVITSHRESLKEICNKRLILKK